LLAVVALPSQSRNDWHFVVWCGHTKLDHEISAIPSFFCAVVELVYRHCGVTPRMSLCEEIGKGGRDDAPEQGLRGGVLNTYREMG
jgi:hypothetical protein